jgi:hypothetical protein
VGAGGTASASERKFGNDIDACHDPSLGDHRIERMVRCSVVADPDARFDEHRSGIGRTAAQPFGLGAWSSFRKSGGRRRGGAFSSGY